MVGVVISLTMLLKILSSKRCRSDADDNLSDAPKKAQMVIFLMMLLKILISKKMMMILTLNFDDALKDTQLWEGNSRFSYFPTVENFAANGS